jgi:formimidoylglutamate deiminase
LRWLEYGRRLTEERRAILADEQVPNVGAWLFRAALAGGARALGRRVGTIEPGARADLVVLDLRDPVLLGPIDDGLLDRVVFAANGGAVRDAIVGGHWVVRDRVHAQEEEIERRYRRALGELLA